MSSWENFRPRVGVPYRTVKEQAENRREAYEKYVNAIRNAGGEPVEISLTLSRGALEEVAGTLDALVLPGSSADVDPARYGATRHARCDVPDPQRERADFTLLEHAFIAKKPVLAICYGIQLLNVYLGGTLVQDISSELATPLRHDWRDRKTQPEPFHPARLEAGSRLAAWAGTTEIRVNSSHHQAVREPGKNLRIVARAPDDVIEAVEWTGGAHWVIGVQWHPERMAGDPLAATLFRQLLAATRSAAVRD